MTVVAAAVALVAGCGDDDDPSVFPDAVPTDTAGAASDTQTGADISGSTDGVHWEFHLKSAEKWEWDVTADSTVHIVWGKDISQSPPGKAQLTAQVSGTFTVNYTPTLAGRTPPEVFAAQTYALYTLTSELTGYARIGGQFADQVGPVFPCEEYAGDLRCNMAELGVIPGFERYPGVSFFVSDMYDERAIDIFLAQVRPVPPHFDIWTPHACSELHFYLDGTVGYPGVGYTDCEISGPDVRDDPP